MTDQHRATPEDWEYIRLRAEDGVGLLNCLLELRARVEALEADQLEQAESHGFCTDAIVRRVEALEATQHAHADLSHLSDAEWDRMAQELAKPAALRPLETEITYGSKAAVDAAQILRAPMVVEGTFEHGGETAMAELRAASAEARPAGLVERVAEGIAAADDEGLTNMTWNYHACAAIREVAAALLEWHDSDQLVHTAWEAAKWLQQEADR
jgi:hypothetical protein